MQEKMHALSWNQPYGTLMLHGKIETRKKPTKVRGEVLICTCQKPYDAGRLLGIAGEEQLTRMNPYGDDPTWNLHGYAIGIGELIDCYPMEKKHEDLCFVKYQEPQFAHTMWPQPSLYLWVFANVQRIEPFVWNFGKQGWGFVPESELPKIQILPAGLANEQLK